jgi:hypothetical protein
MSFQKLYFETNETMTDGEKFRAVAVHGIAKAFADRLRQGFAPPPVLSMRFPLGSCLSR